MGMSMLFLLLVACGGGDDMKVIHPHESVMAALELLKTDKFDEFVRTSFTKEMLTPEGSIDPSELAENIKKREKDKIIKYFENVLQGTAHYGTYNNKKIALLRFKTPMGEKLGMLMYLEGDRYKFGLEETVRQAQIDEMKLDSK